MSGYTVEEPNETPIYYRCDGVIIEEYYSLYSSIQKKRFKKVINQINDIWFDVFNQIKFTRDFGSVDIDKSNNFMLKIHKLFIIQLKNKIEYYNDEKLLRRRNKNYLSKKINKLKNSIKTI